MYLTHFGLHERPFSLTPDTQFFCALKSHKDALNTLMTALALGEGFIKVVGEVGTGKTLLCRMLLARLNRQQFVTAYIPNPWLTPDELKACFANEIGVDIPTGSLAAHQLTAAIYRRLLQLARQKKHVVLLIDEAQAMPRDTLEALRLLSNLETEKRKLLQVVMLGQPELDTLLNCRSLRQLRQRIVFSERLQPFDAPSVRAYLTHRLQTSGHAGDQLLSFTAYWLLARASGGVPRLINVLAHKALLCAFGRGDTRINGWHMARAIADTPECRRVGRLLALLFRWPAPRLAASPVEVKS